MVLMFETIGAAWAEYSAQVIPQGASEGQIHATKKAFYAGTFVMLRMSCQLGEIPEAEAIKKLEEWSAEGDAFVDEVLAEYHKQRREVIAKFASDVQAAVDKVNQSVNTPGTIEEEIETIL